MDVTKSNRNLNDLHPKVKELAEALIVECKKQEINIGISETYRTVERQDYLYFLGRTLPGGIVTNARGTSMSSYHQWRLAFDAFNNVKGDEYNPKILKKVGEIGQKLGLEWGGGWSGFKDAPHFQYIFGLTIKDLISGKKPPAYSSQVVKLAEVDKEYGHAIKVLQEKGAIQSPEAWYPTPNKQYVEALINNMMPLIMEETSYEYHIKILQLLGIIQSPDVWIAKDYQEEYIKILIKNCVKVIES